MSLYFGGIGTPQSIEDLLDLLGGGMVINRVSTVSTLIPIRSMRRLHIYLHKRLMFMLN